jgi:hypothetical protein
MIGMTGTLVGSVRPLTPEGAPTLMPKVSMLKSDGLVRPRYAGNDDCVRRAPATMPLPSRR